MGTQNFRVKNGLEVGSATTITTTSAYVGTNLYVVGVSTFQSDLYVAGSLIAGTGGGGASIGDDIVTRNLYTNGISTFAGAISGSSASFTGDLTVGGVLKYEDVVNVDSVGIATARSGLRITGGGLDVVGVATFNNGVDTLDVIGHAEVDQLRVSGVSTFTGSIDANSHLDVDGHTELDNVNVSGIATIKSLEVQDNVYIGGNLSIGGTTTVISAQDLQIFDKDIILGVTTDVNGNDVSNDTTANHGGIAIASTEGSPLVDLYIVGLETSPVTYKKLMWFKEGSFSGLGTDAWLSNYAVGIGSTQVPNGVRLAAGGVQISDNTIDTTNLNVSGVSTFVGIGTFQNDLFVGGILYAPSLNIENGAILGEDLLTRNILSSGITTVTGATNLNGDLDVDGHTELDNVNIAGILTATSAEFSGDLDVDGHTELDNVNIAGVLTATSATFSGDLTVGGVLKYEDVVNVDSVGIATARSGLRITGGGLDVVGVATFNNNAIFEADLDVGGHTNLTDVSISGITTVAALLDANDGFTANQAIIEDLTNTRVVFAGSGGRLQDSANLIFDGNTLHTTNANVSGIVTAALFSGASQIGIQSNGLAIGAGITQINFIGIGNTFVLNGTTVDVSIAGAAGGGIGTAVDATSVHGGANIYYTDPVLTIDGNVTVDAPSTALASYTTYRDIMVLDEWDLIIEDDNFIVDILGFGSIV